MSRKKVVILLTGLLALTLASGAEAQKKKTGGIQTLDAVMETELITSGTGVYGDGSIYNHTKDGVQAYFGVGGKDVDLVTYDSGRMMHFSFDPSSPALAASGLPSELDSEVDFFGINQWGRFREMANGTTARVVADLEFHCCGPSPTTYELEYSSLCVTRVDDFTWIVSSDFSHIQGNPGFDASPVASLNIIRRNRQTSYGLVSMPIRFTVTLQ
jgi:hypothetical protein